MEGVRFIGLGGAPPGVFKDGNRAFEGFPYRETEDCEEAVRTLLEPQVGNEKSVLVTHFPPFDIGELPFRGSVADTGSKELQDMIQNQQERIAVAISGHLHRQFWIPQYRGTCAVNPGSVLLRNYAVIELEVDELGGCRVVNVELKVIE